MEVLIGVAAADMRLEEARLFATMERNPRDAQRRLDHAKKKVEEYRKALNELPSVEGLARHAQARVEEMDWWDRYIIGRGLVNDVAKLPELGIRDVQLGEPGMGGPATGSYIFWKDRAGATHVRMVAAEALEQLSTPATGRPA
jgi:hypothetical protein